MKLNKRIINLMMRVHTPVRVRLQILCTKVAKRKRISDIFLLFTFKSKRQSASSGEKDGKLINLNKSDIDSTLLCSRLRKFTRESFEAKAKSSLKVEAIRRLLLGIESDWNWRRDDTNRQNKTFSVRELCNKLLFRLSFQSEWNET